MNPYKLVRNASLGLLLLGASGFGLAADEPASKPKGGSGDLHAVMMEGMQDATSMKMSGDVDKDFAMMMISHHRQAIAMSKVLMQRGQNSELKAMAEKMSAQQQKEIEQLKRFE